MIVGAPFQAAAGVKDAWTMVPLWTFMGVILLIPLAQLLKHTKAGPP